jgi:hypothetical protein
VVDEPPDKPSSPDDPSRSRAITENKPKTERAKSEPTAGDSQPMRWAEPHRETRAAFDQIFGMQVQSGAAATLSAFAALPEPVQQQQLANDHQRDKMSFELEAKRIEADRKEAAEERAHELALREQAQRRDDRNDTRAFWFVVGASVFTAVITAILFIKEEYKIAVPMLTGLTGAGLGFQGGKSAGYTKAKREARADSLSKPE